MLTAAHAAAIVVVDRSPSDYHRLAPAARQAGLRFFHLPSGADALRVAASAAVSLWIVNAELPDMTGFELVEQLRPRWRGSHVFLVGDSYREADEVRALSLGITMYLCKPARAAWLSHWRPAPRALPDYENRSAAMRRTVNGWPPGSVSAEGVDRTCNPAR